MRRGPKFVATLIAVALVSVLTALDQTVVSTALPHMIADLQGAAILGWVFTAYLVAATATVALAGKLADLFGRRALFLGAVMVFLVGSLLCGLANSMLPLVLSRAVQGIGAGAINALSLIVMADLFSARERGKWQAINNVGFATASAVGPSVGGVLSDTISWRWIFLINIPVCAVILGVVWYGLEHTPMHVRRPAIDWRGATWSMVGIVCVLLALTWGGNEFAWISPQIGGLLVITALAAVLLRRAEQRADDPLVPAGIVCGPVVPYACVAIFGQFFVWFTMILIAPLRLQLVLGESATHAGALLTPGIVIAPVSAFIAGQLVSRRGKSRLTARIGGLCLVIGPAMLLYVPARAADLWVLLSFAVAGLGTGFCGPSLMTAFQNVIARHQIGAGLGLFSLFRQLGSSVGTAAIGAIVGSSVALVAPKQIEGAIGQAVIVQLAAGLAVLVAVWRMADIPLGTTRSMEADVAGTPTLREAWSHVGAHH